MSITTARLELADAIEGTGYLVFPQPMEVIPVPSITLVPHQPYVALTTVGANRLEVSLRATIAVAYNDNQASLQQLEDLITKFLEALPQGVQIQEFSQPSMVEIGPAKALATDVVVTVTTTKE